MDSLALKSSKAEKVLVMLVESGAFYCLVWVRCLLTPHTWEVTTLKQIS